MSKKLAIGRPTSLELLEAFSFVGAEITKAEEHTQMKSGRPRTG